MTTTFNSVTRIEEKSLNNRLLQGLTIAEIHTLAAVGMHATVPMKTICSKLGVTMATVNASVSRARATSRAPAVRKTAARCS